MRRFLHISTNQKLILPVEAIFNIPIVAHVMSSSTVLTDTFIVTSVVPLLSRFIGFTFVRTSIVCKIMFKFAYAFSKGYSINQF